MVAVVFASEVVLSHLDKLQELTQGEVPPQTRPVDLSYPLWREGGLRLIIFLP